MSGHCYARAKKKVGESKIPTKVYKSNDQGKVEQESHPISLHQLQPDTEGKMTPPPPPPPTKKKRDGRGTTEMDSLPISDIVCGPDDSDMP